MDKKTKNEVSIVLNNIRLYTDKDLVSSLAKLFTISNCSLIGEKDYIKSRNRYKCIDRTNLTRGKIGVIDLVRCGLISNKKKDTFILKQTSVSSQTINVFKPSEYNGPNTQPLIIPINRWVGSDEFTNESIINWILNEIIPDFSVDQLISMICDKNGIQIQEKADMDLSDYINSKKFKPKLLDNMIYQVLNTLDILEKKFNYIHGDLKTKNVLVFKNGKIAKLADYGKSSITYNGTRFYCRLEKIVKRGVSGLLPTSTSTFGKKYKYNLNTIDTNVAMRHRKEIFYLNFDVYTFMVSIALEKKIFYNYIVGNSKGLEFFLNIWDFLWIDTKTRDKVENRIANIIADENKNNQSISATFEVLRGLELRYF